MSDNQFKLQINFIKSYVDDQGRHCLEGVASGPEVDLTDERMAPDALKSMVESIKRRLIEFRDAHKQEWNDDLGEVVELSLDESNHLIYRSVLDMNLSGAKDLWYRVHTLGKKYGVSIGGVVLKAGMEYVAELGRQIYTYFDVDLYEISITRQAAYQYSFANAVLKSLPKGTAMPEENTTKTAEEVVNQPVAAEDQSDATPEATPEVVEEAPVQTEDEAAVPTDAEPEVETEPKGEPESPTEPQVEEPSNDAPTDTDPEVTKALHSAQEEATELRKSLDDANSQVAELTKSLETKTTEAEAALTELVEVKKSLATAEAELEKIEGRKSVAFHEGAKQAVIVDDTVSKSQEPVSIGDLYLQSIGAK